MRRARAKHLGFQMFLLLLFSSLLLARSFSVSLFAPMLAELLLLVVFVHFCGALAGCCVELAIEGRNV